MPDWMVYLFYWVKLSVLVLFGVSLCACITWLRKDDTS